MAKRRPSGDGMVRKRDDGRWEGRIVVGHKDDGSPIFRYVYGSTQKELTAKLRKCITAYQGVELTAQSKITMSEWPDQWLVMTEETVRPGTMRGYRSYVENHIRPVLGEKRITQIKVKDIQKLYDKLGQTLASGTVRRVHTTLHSIMKAAKQMHIMPKNPVEDVIPPKFSYQQKNVLTDEQLERFMDAIKEDEIWHDLFYTEITTGLRRGELCGLRWEDFDEVSGTLKVCRTVRRDTGKGLSTGDTKTYAGTRCIILPPTTAALLRERKKTALTDWIFPNPLKPERPTSPDTAYDHLKVLLRKADLPDIRFHDLRHTFATNALEHGMDIKTLSTIIGHVSSATTLNVYSHVTDDMRKQAAVSIDQGIAKAETQSSNQAAPQKTMTEFRPTQGKRRKHGTGSIIHRKETLWEGRYSAVMPDGTRVNRGVSGKTEEECEAKLADLIASMKAEVAAEKKRLKEEMPA